MIAHLQRAPQRRPKVAEAHSNLAIALAALKRIAELKFENLLCLSRSIRCSTSILGSHWRTAVFTSKGWHMSPRPCALRPRLVDAGVNWANALTLDQRDAEAFPHDERVLAQNPAVMEEHFHFARALAGVEKNDETVTQFRAAGEIAPNFGPAHRILALALCANYQAERACVVVARRGAAALPGARC